MQRPPQLYLNQMNTDPNTQKQCLECYSDIHSCAMTCPHCGSHQNWRRYLPFGESTLALILSTIALTAVILPDPRAAIKEISDYISGTNFAISAVLVDVNIENISILLTNNQNSDAAINSVGCLMHIPLDTNLNIRQSLNDRAEGIMENETLTVSETMGMFLMTFELKTPALISKYQTAVITLPTKVISAPLGTGEDESPEDNVVNFCIVGGVSFEDEFSVGGVIIKPRQLNGIDLLEVLEQAEYAVENEHKREIDIAAVKEVRAKSKSALEAP